MTKTSIFLEPFDTVRTSKDELALAESLLKILMASPDGAVLSTTHAIDSSLLLSERLAGNSAFRSLVQAGRLRFASWPGGIAPPEALDTVLALPEGKYILSGWPELNQDPGLRRLTLEAWNGEINTTGVTSVDERISFAKELFSSADIAENTIGRPIVESPRAKLFADSLKDAPRWLPPDETSRDVAEQVSELAKFKGRDSRSKVYDWINSRDISEATNARLKDLVDGRYNKTVADSLRVPFLSARRVWENLPSDYHESEAVTTGLELFEALADAPIISSVEWSTVRRALSIYGAEPISRESAEEAFKDILAAVAPYKKSVVIGAGAAGIVGGTMVALSLQGAAQGWALLVLTLLSEAIGLGSGKIAGEVLGEQIDDRWRGARLEAYSGWLDSIDEPSTSDAP